MRKESNYVTFPSLLIHTILSHLCNKPTTFADVWKKSTSLSFFLSLDEEIRSADAFNTLTADDAFLTA